MHRLAGRISIFPFMNADRASDLGRRWHRTWGLLRLPPPGDEPDSLLTRYAESHRAYHGLAHLEECFVRYDSAAHLARAPGEVQLALWYHDAVYDPHSDRNEADSAALAEAALRGAGAPAVTVDRVRESILATRHGEPPGPGDPALVVDVDLGILAAAPDRFAEYERQIRQEYAWVPEELYRTARRRILEGFLVRPAIYATEWFRERDEPRARENLRQALARLGG